MAADEGSWRTPSFRQSVVSKIDEAISHSGMPTARNSVDMENHVFQKAKSKEEYLSYVARLILHVREINTKKGGNMSGPGRGQGGPGMPDPINALQTLASQGTRNTQMMGVGPQGGPVGGQNMPNITATNLLQTLNQRPGQGIGQMHGMQNRMPGMGMGPNTGQMNPMQAQMTNQMGTQNINQIQNQLPNQIQSQLNVQLQGQVTQMGNVQNPINQIPQQMQPNLGNQLQTPLQNQMMGQLGNQMAQLPRKPDAMMMNNPNANFPGPRNPTPTQFLRQSPTPSVQSPAGLGGPPSGSQMVASPALVPSPSPQMNIMSGPQRSVGMAPSPSSSLNTPGQAVPTPSPQEDQAYREKVRQLSKYIEPLRKMIAKMGNDDVEKLSKMKKLLEILSNPSQRMPLETLLKCEVVLEKLDFNKRGEGGSVAPTTTTQLIFKEHHIFNPLLEAVSNNLGSPTINHTLHRTFGPTLEALFGPEIKLPPPLKRKRVEEPTSDIPGVLQGEIARLDQRFKVSLDPSHQPGSHTVQLLCWLDDRHLPCVPPVSLSVPEDYPKSSPSCHMAPHEYNATQFLSSVQKALLARIKKLPRHFSVSQLLDTWEMSVRQASAPTQKPVSTSTVLMGL